MIQGYNDITLDNWVLISHNNDSCDISDKDLFRLESRYVGFTFKFLDYSGWTYTDNYVRYNLHLLRIRHFNKRLEKRCHIFKAEDEWYYVKVGEGKRIYYYKCDQIEGLIECLDSFFGL